MRSRGEPQVCHNPTPSVSFMGVRQYTPTVESRRAETRGRRLFPCLLWGLQFLPLCHWNFATFLVVTMFQVMIHWLEGRSGKKGTQHQGPCVTRDDITSSHGSRKGGMGPDMITRPFIFSSYQLRSSDSTILLILNL